MIKKIIMENIEKIVDLVKRLREPANWMAQERGGGKNVWKNGSVTRYDRAPLEAAEILEEIFLIRNAESRSKSETAKGLKANGLSVRQIQKVMKLSSPSVAQYYIKK